MIETLRHWLDVRPGEGRSLILSVLGAFLVIAFMTLARALREAVYLTTFDVRTLPYITAAVVALSLPTVGAFTKLLAGSHPRTVLRAMVLILMAGLAVIWPIATRDPGPLFSATVVGFYLWTALGTLVITSGFWVVTSELFAVRGAKRLFGLIGAGGTAGAMVMGLSLSAITRRVELAMLVPTLIGILGIFLVVQWLLPRPMGETSEPAGSDPEPTSASFGETLSLIWNSPHLRTIALIVLIASMASALVDYQFKEFARLRISDDAGLTGFFGAFYGWTGGIALAIQLVGAARIMAVAGIGAGLSALALFLLLGSTAFLVVPGLALITFVRGADNSLRKALHRPLIEFLYVPIPAMLRRKTKTFIDSIVDSLGEGFGAALVFLWVTLPHLPSRYLSVFVIVLAIGFIVLSRRMGREYFETIVTRLKEGDADVDPVTEGAALHDRDLLSATFTRMDVHSMLIDARLVRESIRATPEEGPGADVAASTGDPLTRLRSSDNQTVLDAMEEISEWDAEFVTALVRLLARDPLRSLVVDKLVEIEDAAVPLLARMLKDESTDFVIRRRIPRVLARIGDKEAEGALLAALSGGRFEVRYRAAIALTQRRKQGLSGRAQEWRPRVWDAVRAEVGRGRPVWELQKLLDDSEPGEDDLVISRVGVRGELSLEHTFRLLSLVLDPEPVRAAFHGITMDEQNLKNYALEYLEHALPADIRNRLWVFIGDVSEYQKAKAARPLGEVVNDLMTTRATLFAGEKEREALRRMLEETDES